MADHMPNDGRVYAVCANPACRRAGQIVRIVARGLCSTCDYRWRHGLLRMEFPDVVARTCKCCGQEFRVSPQKVTKYCSARCQRDAENAAKRARKRKRVAPDAPVVLVRAVGAPWALESDPWPGLQTFGCGGLPVPMSTSVQPWGM